MIEATIVMLCICVVALVFGHLVILRALTEYQRSVVEVQKDIIVLNDHVIRLNAKEIIRNQIALQAAMEPAEAEERFLR